MCSQACDSKKRSMLQELALDAKYNSGAEDAGALDLLQTLDIVACQAPLELFQRAHRFSACQISN
jgi:hypothetical protein